ncbi:zinc protease [Schaalia meyeri]|uniref:M16 family metallopeptidase n=1 Tax=Schaalia meyeri TaxID=52773 RepID=UPI000681B06D|nr:pitrilysin family protein [Schaalia meyeri]AKU64688.1 zinc protease [Schaalia meyeri]OFQ25398.1 zinc protease [Actinomyces sp. HMSC062G12]
MTPKPLPLNEANLSIEDGDTRVDRTILGCGARVLTQTIPATKSAGISLWVPVGSRDEEERTAGSTHFLEHLLFKGTHARSALDIAISFDSVGGESNAETAREHTAYWARVRDADLDMAIETLTDMVSDSRLDGTDFAMERGVILDELAMGEDSPTDTVHDAFQLAVHGDRPIGRPVGGTAQAISGVDRADVWEHYQAHYAPSSLIVAAAGSVDHDHVCERVQAALDASPWDAGGAAAPRPRRSTTRTPIADHEREITRRRDVTQTHVVIGCEGLSATDPTGPTMSVLLSILGGSMSSRLFQEVREKRGLAYTTYAFDVAYSDTGTFGMYAGCSPDKAAEVEAIMRAQLHDLASDGPTEEEMTRVRGQVRGNVVLGLEDNWSRMMRLGRSEIIGRYRPIDESLAEFEAVDARDVRALAASLATKLDCRALVLPAD